MTSLNTRNMTHNIVNITIPTNFRHVRFGANDLEVITMNRLIRSRRFNFKTGMDHINSTNLLRVHLNTLNGVTQITNMEFSNSQIFSIASRSTHFMTNRKVRGSNTNVKSRRRIKFVSKLRSTSTKTVGTRTLFGDFHFGNVRQRNRIIPRTGQVHRPSIGGIHLIADRGIGNLVKDRELVP